MSVEAKCHGGDLHRHQDWEEVLLCATARIKAIPFGARLFAVNGIGRRREVKPGQSIRRSETLYLDFDPEAR